jgi:hypothetical protein
MIEAKMCIPSAALPKIVSCCFAPRTATSSIPALLSVSLLLAAPVKENMS